MLRPSFQSVCGSVRRTMRAARRAVARRVMGPSGGRSVHSTGRVDSFIPRPGRAQWHTSRIGAAFMTAQQVLDELERLGNPSIKKVLMKHGAVEPFFGTKIGDMQPMKKKLMGDHKL